MKSGIHPEYREVVFQDISSDFSFITRSTLQTKDKIKWTDGKEYPLYKLETSSESHPFYTGAQTRVTETGRVEKFRQKFADQDPTGQRRRRRGCRSDRGEEGAAVSSAQPRQRETKRAADAALFFVFA